MVSRLKMFKLKTKPLKKSEDTNVPKPLKNVMGSNNLRTMEINFSGNFTFFKKLLKINIPIEKLRKRF